jgi:prepilin signal peptidase PulO-like enzyme (type II secretory pathway)
MDNTIILLVKITILLIISIVSGNGIVVLFNHLPYKWFLNDGEKPTPEILGYEKQRLTSTPWKWIFVSLFATTTIYMNITISFLYAVTVLIVMNLLLISTISDIKYGILPDQISIMIAVSSIGFFALHDSWTEQLYGAITGFSLLMLLWIAGKLIYKRDAVGGGDIKIFSSLGLAMGIKGILMIFIISTFLSAIHFGFLLITKRAKLRDTRPMMPYIFMSFLIYVVFLWNVNIL